MNLSDQLAEAKATSFWRRFFLAQLKPVVAKVEVLARKAVADDRDEAEDAWSWNQDRFWSSEGGGHYLFGSAVSEAMKDRRRFERGIQKALGNLLATPTFSEVSADYGNLEAKWDGDTLMIRGVLVSSTTVGEDVEVPANTWGSEITKALKSTGAKLPYGIQWDTEEDGHGDERVVYPFTIEVHVPEEEQTSMARKWYGKVVDRIGRRA